jgi:hypothetical protein
MCGCTSGNLEISGLVLAHHPGMTTFLRGGIPLFAAFGGADVNEMAASDACAAAPFRRTVDIKSDPFCQERS